MKGNHCKHEQINPMTIQLNNIYYRNMNVVYNYIDFAT